MKLAKQNPPVFPRQTVEQAFIALLEQHLYYMRQWEDAAHSWQDTEGVHQLRVALRRMRAILRIFRPAVPRELTDSWRDTMRDLALQLAPARDLDVLINEGIAPVAGKLPLAGGDKLRRLAQHRREAAYVGVRKMLASDAYEAFKRGFADWLAPASWRRSPAIIEHREVLVENVGDFAKKVLKKHRKRVRKQGRTIDADVPEELHRLRIECKKLRYAAECFAPLYTGMSAFIGHLKNLQDVLGAMNDVTVTQRLLADLLVDVSDPEIAQYSAGLIGWRYCEYQHLQANFGSRWQEFLDARKPW